MTNTKAAQLEAELAANVDAFYARRITYDEFNRNGRTIWDRIAAADAICAVQSILRNKESRS